MCTADYCFVYQLLCDNILQIAVCLPVAMLQHTADYCFVYQLLCYNILQIAVCLPVAMLQRIADQSYENGESGDPCPTYGYRGYDISNCSRVQSSPHTLTYDPSRSYQSQPSPALHDARANYVHNFDNHEQVRVADPSSPVAC